MKQVKIGFEFEGIFHKPGVQVDDKLASLFPDNVKDVPVKEVPKEEPVKKEEKVVEEVKEEPKTKKAKKAKK